MSQQLPDINKPIAITEVLAYLRNILSAVVRPIMLNPTSNFIRGVDAVTTVATVSSLTAGTITTVTTLTNIGATTTPAYTTIFDINRLSYTNAVRGMIA